MSEFFNGDAISDVEEICNELTEEIYTFWTKYHENINFGIGSRRKLFEKNPWVDN